MPQELLTYTPLYCIVGAYRLASDVGIRDPVWAKCRNGTRRGAVVGLVWAVLTFSIQRAFVGFFLVKSPRVVALSDDNFMGLKIPLATYATFIFVSSQVTYIIQFFLSKNLGIARSRAWDLTVTSRAKTNDFWGPYIEEWKEPPEVEGKQRPGWEKLLSGWVGRFVIKKVLTFHLDLFVPFAGLFLSAAIKAISMSSALHEPYFKIKKMTPNQIAIFMTERRVDYFLFGFTSALLESIPLIGLIFSVSNRIGAAMWAFDLEKRQALFRSGSLKPEKRATPRPLSERDITIASDTPGGWGKVH